jgi:hypothetical protein
MRLTMAMTCLFPEQQSSRGVPRLCSWELAARWMSAGDDLMCIAHRQSPATTTHLAELALQAPHGGAAVCTGATRINILCYRTP